MYMLAWLAFVSWSAGSQHRCTHTKKKHTRKIVFP
jgi:hypothetical protein